LFLCKSRASLFFLDGSMNNCVRIVGIQREQTGCS
jgi:hypothetical protein